MGGDSAPDTVVDGALLVADERPDVQVLLVGPEGVAAELLDRRNAAGRFPVVNATQHIAMDEDPARAVRAKRDASVRVAARLVRDGAADATVSVGSTGAAMAAALFTLGRLPGVTRPAIAVVVPALNGPVVLLDAGANPDAGPDLLAQFALAGVAYATTRGIDQPRVGLLSNGAEPGKGDETRKAAYALLETLPIDFVGNVEGHDVALGGRADVVVTDGFTGNVLLKGIEGALAMSGAAVPDRLDPERLGGALLLGVDGIAVLGHGSSSARAVASCVGLAADAVADGLLPRLREALDGLVRRRRQAAGLAVNG
ncbi:MAG: phosphate acyltransferase [Frankiaceae bacterium]|jgi:glycerol-3-phosphate acyltransferase PlsX|nr:phosphate acyltransferase [Frankiaceae bacterium]